MAIARLAVTALDCPDPVALATFYSALTGWPVRAEEADDSGLVDWVELDAGGGPTLAFQRVARLVPPTWPDGPVPQQLHLDFAVPDLDAGEAAVLALGAAKTPDQPGETFRVFLDPVGHPFCLVTQD